VKETKQFTVLDMDGPEFVRGKAEGKIISVSKTKIEITISFPLQPRQLICWVDQHKKEEGLHFAVVKQAKKTGDTYRVVLSLLQ
jgi:hypothetical protein